MKHFTEIKPDTFALENLIGWLERQPPDEKYTYRDHCHCLLSQYFSAMGYEDVVVYSNPIFLHSNEVESSKWDSNYARYKSEYPIEWNQIARDGRKTFGDALKRARSIQSCLFII